MHHILCVRCLFPWIGDASNAPLAPHEICFFYFPLIQRLLLWTVRDPDALGLDVFNDYEALWAAYK